MREIKNWEAIILEDNEKTMAIPLPGCIIRGELDNDIVEIKAIDVNLSKLIITDIGNEKYMLSGAREGYLNKLETFIELGKDRKIEESNRIDLRKEIEKGIEKND